MVYNSNFFCGNFGEISTTTFTIYYSDLLKINKLKSSVVESSYYDKMLTWNLEDNLDVISDSEEFSKLFVAMQFITMIGELSPDLVDKLNTQFNFKLEQYHISLLRNLYLEFDDDDSTISMAYKRPFGNSSVLSDVRDEVRKNSNILYDEDSDDDWSVEEKVLDEFVIFLSEFFKDGYVLKYMSFVYNSRFANSMRGLSSIEKSISKWTDLGIRAHHYYLTEWSVSLTEIRDLKIKKIISEA